MTFGFSLYVMSLLAILVTYFRIGIKELSGWRITREWQCILLPTLEIDVSFS